MLTGWNSAGYFHEFALPIWTHYSMRINYKSTNEDCTRMEYVRHSQLVLATRNVSLCQTRLGMSEAREACDADELWCRWCIATILEIQCNRRCGANHLWQPIGLQTHWPFLYSPKHILQSASYYIDTNEMATICDKISLIGQMLMANYLQQ